MTLYSDSANVVSSSDYNKDPMNINLFIYKNGYTAKTDWVLVRKYIESGPTDSNWSNENEISLLLTEDNPGLSCKDILDRGMSYGNGEYWVDINGGDTADKFKVYCDMTTDGGGWTIWFNQSRPHNSTFSSNYSNFTRFDISTTQTPTASTQGIDLRINDMDYTEIAVLSIDGSPYSANCKWQTNMKFNSDNWNLKSDGQPFVIMGNENNGVYPAGYGITGTIKNYSSKIHTKWSILGVSNDGVTTTLAEMLASKFFSMSVYNTEYKYYNQETCTNGNSNNFNSAIIGVR